MRRSLFSSLPILFLIACNGNAGNTTVQTVEADSVRVGIGVSDPDTTDRLRTVNDDAFIGPQEENPSVNTTSKEVKASKSDGVLPAADPNKPGSGVREHGSPNKSALDSLKEAKSKGKK